MSTKDRLIERMPTYYKKDPITNEIQNAYATEIDRLTALADDIKAQRRPSTATWGIYNWEKMFGIPVDVTKPLQERREMVMAKRLFFETVTIPKIKQVVTAWAGAEVEVIENYEIFNDFGIAITFVGKRGIPANMDDLRKTMRALIPAYLKITYVFTYATWGETKARTWGETKLDTWKQVREREWN